MSTTGPSLSERLVAGRYRLGDCLGKGGMGAVFRAFDEIIGEPVALKVILHGDPDLVERLKREVVLARRVTHKNIARTFDMGLDRDGPFITMELIEGESLRARFADHARPLDEVVLVLAQICAGLAAAHEVGVIHRDLKPGNVLVGDDGRVVVIDFGVAAPAGLDTDELVGTFDYMSPEQVRGTAPRPASDVYAVGLMAFEMITRKRPFEGATAHERAFARLDTAAPSLVGFGDLPDDVARLVDRCLDLDPEQRPPAADAATLFAGLAKAKPAPRITRSAHAAPVTDAAPTTAAPRQRVRTIRVLPFSSEGPVARAWDVGESLAEELRDLLSRTKGIEVLWSTRDGSVSSPNEAHADLIVQGTVRQENGALLVTARLIEDTSGDQLWSARFDGPVGELLDIGTQLAAQITESLRLELEARPERDQVSEDALKLYLQARRILRTPTSSPSQALRLLDQCLEIAPSFPAAVAARAVAVARAYFLGDFGAGSLIEEAPRAIERALAEAPLLPDTHLALGLLALQEGRFRIATDALVRTVEMAPTYTIALEQLGRTEAESGRGAQGIARLKFAARLDPERRTCLYPVARAYALRNNLDAFDRTLAEIVRLGQKPTIEDVSMQLRVAVWTQSAERARAARRRLDEIPEHFAFDLIGLAADMAAGEPVDRTLRTVTEKFLELPLSPRLRTVIHQSACENWARRDAAYAATHLDAAVELPLTDIEWIELCPSLDPLRQTPGFERGRTIVQERVRSMWSSTRG